MARVLPSRSVVNSCLFIVSDITEKHTFFKLSLSILAAKYNMGVVIALWAPIILVYSIALGVIDFLISFFVS